MQIKFSVCKSWEDIVDIDKICTCNVTEKTVYFYRGGQEQWQYFIMSEKYLSFKPGEFI